MFGRILLGMLVVGLSVTAFPLGEFSPVERASASCLYIAEVDECVNPCITAQQLLRRAGLPVTIFCPA